MSYTAPRTMSLCCLEVSAAARHAHQRRGVSCGGALGERTQKALGPMAEIIAHKHLENIRMPLATLLKRHRKGTVDGVADALRIVWIDQQRSRTFVRRPGKS